MSATPPTTRSQLLGQSSEAQIVLAAARLKGNLNSGLWLPQTNSYYADCVGTVKTHNPSNFVVNDLAEYFATAMVAHCLDGWGFLGRAVNNHINGTPSIAIHMAYYAELRAAMAILATEGIGVLKNIHLVFDSATNVTPVNDSGTHSFTWRALQDWIGRAGSGVRVIELIQSPAFTLFSTG